MQIKIIKFPDHPMPSYGSEKAAGLDCYARVPNYTWLKAGERLFVPLGFSLELPDGYNGEIRPRSGLSRYSGLSVVLGTIDSDYRGEVCALLHSLSKQDLHIRNHMKVCQLVIAPIARVELIEATELTETARGKNGFGSTGT